jgi:hypothetical protein
MPPGSTSASRLLLGQLVERDNSPRTASGSAYGVAGTATSTITFPPGVLGQTMRWTNRPTFHQLMECNGHR